MLSACDLSRCAISPPVTYKRHQEFHGSAHNNPACSQLNKKSRWDDVHFYSGDIVRGNESTVDQNETARAHCCTRAWYGSGRASLLARRAHTVKGGNSAPKRGLV